MSQLKSDAVRQVLEFAQRLTKSYPADAVSFDDASNNRALISGKSALIFNPPSAWAVAKRDAPTVAADCWTFPAPAGPKGRFVPTLSYFWGVYKFSPNKSAAKELIEYLMQPRTSGAALRRDFGLRSPALCRIARISRCGKRSSRRRGQSITIRIRPWHKQQPSLAAAEASPEIAVQIYNRAIHNQMMARIRQGQTIPQVIAWAQDELEGFAR